MYPGVGWYQDQSVMHAQQIQHSIITSADKNQYILDGDAIRAASAEANRVDRHYHGHGAQRLHNHVRYDRRDTGLLALAFAFVS